MKMKHHNEALKTRVKRIIGAVLIGTITCALMAAKPCLAGENPSLPQGFPLLLPQERSDQAASCGTLALQEVARVLKGEQFDVKLLLAAPVPPGGFSLAALTEIANQAGLGLVAVQWQAGEPLVVPCVAHYRIGHYVAIVALQGDRYEVIDPRFKEPLWLKAAAVARFASGAFLVPETSLPEHWSKLPTAKAESIHGGIRGGACPTCSSVINDSCANGGGGTGSGMLLNAVGSGGCAPCGSGGGAVANSTGGSGSSCNSCPAGMMVWEVSEPYINLWVNDEPMGYQPGLGGRISFKLSYKQMADAPVNSSFFNVGPNWNCSWLSYILDTSDTEATGGDMYLPGGGVRSYLNLVGGIGPNPEYYSQSTLARNTDGSGNLTGFVITYPNGAIDYYNQVSSTLIDGETPAFLTAHVDPAGHSNQFTYVTNSGVLQLVSVIDTDGRTSTLTYGNGSFPAQITRVDDPFGNHATLAYDITGRLTNVTDVVGLSSSVVYNSDNSITNLITPYGTTTFRYTTDGTTNDVITRAIQVVDALGGTNIYMYRYSSQYLNTNHATALLPSSYPSGEFPTNPPTATLDNGSVDVPMYAYNSFHWGPLQCANLSTTTMTNFTVADYKKARRKHWLLTTGSVVGHTVSMQCDPSVDGINDGQKTWYDYDGKIATYIEGTDFQPSLVAQVIPDGTTKHTYYIRDGLGHPTSITDTYSAGYGSMPTNRTTQYVYDAVNGIDLIQVIGPLGETLAGYSYNADHQVLTWTNAVGEVTTNTYDAQQRLTTVTTPAGLVTTYVYFPTGAYTNWVQSVIGKDTLGNAITGTNSYTYVNDLVETNIDQRGLTNVSTWDALRRLVRVDYPDSTYIGNTYSNLDLIQVLDRLGHTNSFAFDALRHKTAEANTMGKVTTYNYCTCGALQSVQDPLTNITYFYYDNLGRVTNSVYADGYSVTNYFTSLGQVYQTIDSAGRTTTSWFNNQGMLYAKDNNAFGREQTLTFDIKDRVTNSVDANGVVITNTWDDLGRLLTRSYPDLGNESYTYSQFGLVTYVNQLNHTNFYGYDVALRKTAETNPNGEVTQYSYDFAGDLATLTDAKTNITTWHYDIYGNVSNKVDAASNVLLVYGYDANNRLTSRHSIAMGDTSYAYDFVGNLTNITYTSTVYTNHSIVMAYDAVNRLTNMIDGVGTTSYAYDAAGHLLSEDGPWADDTVSFTYNNRLRSSLSLQQPNADAWNQTYAYDLARRMTTNTSPAGPFVYQYDTNRQMQISKLTLPNTSYIANSYDTVARMLTTTLCDSTNGVLNSHGYSYNQGNERTQQVFTKTNYVDYTYDKISQLTSATGKEFGGTTNRWMEQMGYGYDAAHNLSLRTNNFLVQTFNVNALNELTTATRTNALTVAGTSSSLATSVTVNNGSSTFPAILYADATFASSSNFTLANGNNTFTAIAADALGRHATNSITVNLPATNSYNYDLNGNLLSDGVRAFDYDDENQLIRVTVTSTWKSEFSYDGKMRMRKRKEFTWSGGTFVETNEVHYVYDGNVVIQERDTNNLPGVTYTRGKDLSRGLQGAGGIGGLLARTDNGSQQTTFYHADGNGNITALINAQQTLVAKYLYDTFGNVVSQSGSLAEANLYRFSSKEYHQNSGLIYYLYRFYDPNLQRWLNKDPLEERGGLNLYAFVHNNPCNDYDPFGLNAAVVATGVCSIFTIVVETIAAAIVAIPASAVIVSAVIIGGALVVTYSICNTAVATPAPYPMPPPWQCSVNTVAGVTIAAGTITAIVASDTPEKRKCRQDCHADFDRTGDLVELPFCLRRCNGGWYGPTPRPIKW